MSSHTDPRALLRDIASMDPDALDQGEYHQAAADAMDTVRRLITEARTLLDEHQHPVADQFTPDEIETLLHTAAELHSGVEPDDLSELQETLLSRVTAAWRTQLGEDYMDVRNAEQAWTFFGHWHNGEIVVDYAEAGEHQDDRVDDGQHEQGLWCASATGATQAKAEVAAIAEYEPNQENR